MLLNGQTDEMGIVWTGLQIDWFVGWRDTASDFGYEEDIENNEDTYKYWLATPVASSSSSQKCWAVASKTNNTEVSVVTAYNVTSSASNSSLTGRPRI